MTSPYKLASVLLQYPTTALFNGLGLLEAEAARLPRRSAAPLGRFLGWLPGHCAAGGRPALRGNL